MTAVMQAVLSLQQCALVVNGLFADGPVPDLSILIFSMNTIVPWWFAKFASSCPMRSDLAC